ncbi:hypothetical protein KM043_007121 [Ampulex compressa]|nr:hypothetical protein KM043_007121 [Ampulex compressa]
MAENGGQSEEFCMLDIEKKFERPARGREQRMGKAKEKLDDGHLPTPPPDPWTNPAYLQNVQGQTEAINPRCLEEEEDIIAYLADLSTPLFEGQASECPSRNSATSNMAVATLCTEEAFEHLDRLYALTEQILELRDRNSRFFKRVRDLEKLKALKNADRTLERAFSKGESVLRDFPEEDTGFAESLLDAMLSNSRDHQIQSRNLRSPSSRRRSRSLGLSEQSTPLLSINVNRPDGEKRVPQSEATNGAPKVSKWTRVKAAFKWERACTNDTIETVEPTTTTTPSTPTTKYLRIPEIGSGNWSGSTLSPSTSEVSGPSTPVGRVSSASSSNEGSYDGSRKSTSRHSNRQSVKIRENGKGNATNRRSRSLDGDIIITDANNGEETSEGSQGRPLIRITLDSNAVAHSLNTAGTKSTESSSKRLTPTLTITIPSNEEELRSISSPESISPLLPSSQNSGGNSPQYTKIQESSTSREFKRQPVMEEPTTPAPKMQRQDSKWNKVRRAFLTNAAFSVPPSPIRTASGQSFLHEGRSYAQDTSHLTHCMPLYFHIIFHSERVCHG